MSPSEATYLFAASVYFSFPAYEYVWGRGREVPAGEAPGIRDPSQVVLTYDVTC